MSSKEKDEPRYVTPIYRGEMHMPDEFRDRHPGLGVRKDNRRNVLLAIIVLVLLTAFMLFVIAHS